jgi:hypothetical protein
MLRFSIRDVLWLMVVAGLACGWWIERRHLISVNEQNRQELFKMGFRLVPFESFAQGIDRIYAIRDSLQIGPPSPDEALEIIHYVRYDRDYKIRIRAMAILPFVNERDEAIAVLLEALNEREGERSGDGTIPQYAVRYLAEMNAHNAVSSIREWLRFLKERSPYDDEMTSIMIKSTERHLAKLAANADSIQTQHK